MRSNLRVNEMTWKTFWFESNAAWGLADSEEAWDNIKANYNNFHKNDDPDLIYNATSASFCDRDSSLMLNFGFRMEHIGGKKTLRDFFNEHGMSFGE